MSKFVQVLTEELGGSYAWTGWPIIRGLLGLLPPGAFFRLRSSLLRLWGLKIGRATLLVGTPVLAGDSDPRKHLKIGERCFINWPVHFDINGEIAIGHGVSIGHHVTIVTTGHEIGDREFRAGKRVVKPVSIGDGAWIGAGATLLPGVIIGAGAIVAAGAVVSKDVASNALVGGVPAKLMRYLD